MSKKWRERREFLRSEVARLSLLEKESATDYEIAEVIDRNYEVTNGGELTNAVDIARAILAKFDVRQK